MKNGLSHEDVCAGVSVAYQSPNGNYALVQPLEQRLEAGTLSDQIWVNAEEWTV